MGRKNHSFVLLADRLDLVPVLANWHMNEWGYLHKGEQLDSFERRLTSWANRSHLPACVVALDEDGEPALDLW